MTTATEYASRRPPRKQPGARAMTATEIAHATRWYCEAVIYFNAKPWTRTPPAISVGPRRIAFQWFDGVAILTMRAGWQLWNTASNNRRSPLAAADVVRAVKVRA